MGPLDSILGGALGAGGGLMDLLQQFQQAGRGPQADSWVGPGQNLPISPEQLMQVFGRGQVEQMAASTGMDVDQVSSGLSDLLPQLIDRVTPRGQVEEAGREGALADLSRMLPR